MPKISYNALMNIATCCITNFIYTIAIIWIIFPSKDMGLTNIMISSIRFLVFIILGSYFGHRQYIKSRTFLTPLKKTIFSFIRKYGVTFLLAFLLWFAYAINVDIRSFFMNTLFVLGDASLYNQLPVLYIYLYESLIDPIAMLCILVCMALFYMFSRKAVIHG